MDTETDVHTEETLSVYFYLSFDFFFSSLTSFSFLCGVTLFIFLLIGFLSMWLAVFILPFMLFEQV